MSLTCQPFILPEYVVKTEDTLKLNHLKRVIYRFENVLEGTKEMELLNKAELRQINQWKTKQEKGEEHPTKVLEECALKVSEEKTYFLY